MEVKLNIVCKKCDGTGVYVGMAERDGASVVCSTCNGTGCQKYSFKYEKFKERKKAKNIKRVFKQTYGYCIGTKAITLTNGVFVDFSKEGVSYEEFLQGKKPQHIRHMACPMLADQSACHEIKGFVDKCNRINGGYLSHISSCKCGDKMKCWEIFDHEMEKNNK